MTGQAGEIRQWMWRLCAACLPALAGCLSFVHPIEPPTRANCQTCQAVPGDCREHVHIFLLHGLDPFDCANMSGLRDYLVDLGFKNVHYGQCFSGCWFRDKIVEIDRCDPEARFAVIGFCVGARAAQSLAEHLTEETVPVHLVVYLDGNCLREFRCRPERKHPRVVNVTAPGVCWKTPDLKDADNFEVPASWHYSAVAHPVTLDLLCQELTELADSVTPLPALPPQATETKAKPVPPIAEVVYQASQSKRMVRRSLVEIGPPADVATKPAPVPIVGTTAP